jgi:hypothetical protein
MEVPAGKVYVTPSANDQLPRFTAAAPLLWISTYWYKLSCGGLYITSVMRMAPSKKRGAWRNIENKITFFKKAQEYFIKILSLTGSFNYRG